MLLNNKDAIGMLKSQWRNRRGGGRGQGAEYPPKTSDQEISADLPGKERQEKSENGAKKRRWKIENGRRKESYKIFKTIKICCGSTKTGIFYREKAFQAGKKIRKNYFAPSEKYSSYTPVKSICRHIMTSRPFDIFEV